MQRIRMGLIGGGPGSFIGAVHRLAAEMDRQIELVAGAFSSDPVRSSEAGRAYGIDPDRTYASYEAMIAAEAERSDGIDFVAIVTPNHVHLPAARSALNAGIAVMCDKPMTATLEQARELALVVGSAGAPFRLTYTYTGYPLVREARHLVREGALGKVRKVVVEYSQGWLAEPIERQGSKQAEWRSDPERSGEGGCVADIGVHAFNLAEFVTGQRVERLCADLSRVVEGRQLDDDCNILLRFDNGAPGALIASQIAVGDLNGLSLRVYGEKAALHWRQEQPNSMRINHISGRGEIIEAGIGLLGPDARSATRVPPGHPEGYLEAFANLYRDFAALLRGEGDAALVPGLKDGLRGMEFIHQAVASSQAGSAWVQLEG
ncbi:MAG TPA: Gfo/Idh/MocA family oxidoreductase [Sphingomicrobium sp.]|nr:Gfo/Idh/MocA family oxidoreductase [Sphingomicrobium sp.]